MKRIFSILPPREGFSPSHFGAIALCAREFTDYSRYRENITVIGGMKGEGFSGIHYQAHTHRRWWQGRSAAYAAECLRYAQQQTPVIVEVHNRPILAKFLCKHWQGKVALHLHNDPQEMKQAKTPAERQWLLEHCAVIYCVSEYIRQRFVEGLSGEISKVKVVYNGLEIPAEIPAQKQKHIVFIGRLKPEKGGLELAHALARILPENPEWKAIFIGAAQHNPNAKTSRYEELIHQALAPVKAQVEMRGFCNYTETMQALAEAQIAVVPSTWNEAFGRTALEALASGCVTVSSVRGGLKEVVGNAAIALEEITPESLCKALRVVFETPESWAQWRHRAVMQAQQFDIRKCAAILDEIREGLLR